METLKLAFLGLWALSLPNQPSAPNHPGSDAYEYIVSTEKINIDGRSVEVVYPSQDSFFEAPLVVFGHGQALNFKHYKATFEHLAKKGIIVIHPKYDSGFFDTNWKKMASSYNSLTQKTLERFKDKFKASKVTYSGHSKGGYVALMAAGAPNRLESVDTSIVVFAPAGYDAEYLNKLDPNIPLSLVWSEADSIIKKADVETIYNLAPVNVKQMILVQNYADREVGHFFPLTTRSAFGGESSPNALHFYGSWKWLTASALHPNTIEENPYLFGPEALSSGENVLTHLRLSNWGE